MEFTSWPLGVNKIILSDATISLGENAVASDSSENGSEMTYLKSSGAPDTYSVSMIFSNATDDDFYLNHVDSNGNHITEWQAFCNWFKYTAKMGTKPFYFHRIDDPREDAESRIYKIKSNGMPKGTAQGNYMKVPMVWQEWITEYFTIQDEDVEVDTAVAVNGRVDIRFNEIPVTTPVRSDFSGSSSDYYELPTQFAIEKIEYDGFKTCSLYFDSFTIPGTYSITLKYNKKTLTTKVIIPNN